MSAAEHERSRERAQRQLGHDRIEQMRREQLRQMTEADAARIFSQLDPPRPYVLRPTSGLVEQQLRFAKLREELLRETHR
jgi:hypothetical protein